MAAPITERMSVEEYMNLPETNLPTELIDGEVVEMPAPSDLHQSIIIALLKWLFRTATTGTLRTAPTDVFIDQGNAVQPDLFWVAADSQCLLIENKFWRGAPDLVIEVLSEATARRDRKIKYALYEQYGTREYWLVNPLERSIEVFVQQDGRFVRHGLFFDEETLTSPLLAAEVVVTELFPAL